MADTQTRAKLKKRKSGGFYIVFIATTLLGGSLPIFLSHGFTLQNTVTETDSNHQFLHNFHKKSNSNSDYDPQKDSEPKPSRIAGLDCEPWGGPKKAAEMVYWEDIPQDSKHASPFYKPDGPPQYFSFEMDFAGFNNVRWVY